MSSFCLSVVSVGLLTYQAVALTMVLTAHVCLDGAQMSAGGAQLRA